MVKKMDEQRCGNISVENFNISEQCLDGLKRAGFRTVDEIVEWFENSWGQGNSVEVDEYFAKYIDETIAELKAMGCWPESLKGE